ncbi:MAG TPA: DNA polymerase III subunit gamma/tau [Caulifigura sp.]|nr:DNA polymerase III subunit gamma/tau [Caulifigura sp.]
MEQQAAYTVLARRFRPQTFDDVVGQDQIAQALRNSIRSGRVAHAYLFTGARGVGKTSSARIFAKALNCLNAADGVPCNDCDICRGISAGTDVDVLEIDGASNRGIDDIRQLRSNVNVKSMRSPYKVYIIDEVHMLTKEAFNALLKTLEEPPPNVKFIFCTTEPNKVPDTILSRCQRFDFGVIATQQIAMRLAEIADKEGIRVDEDAVNLVARRAAGSMRDSQSLFDQLLAFGAEHITVEDVHRLLGTAPDDRLFGLFEAIGREDRAGVLEDLDRSLAQGCQLGSLTEQLLGFLRDLMVTAAGAGSVSLMSISDSNRERVNELAGRLGLRRIGASLQILADCRGRMQRTTYGRPLLELALVRMTLLGELSEIGASLEAGPTGTTAPAARPAAPARPLPSTAPARPSFDAKKKELIEPPAERGLAEVDEPGPQSAPAPAPVRESRITTRTLVDLKNQEVWEEVLERLPEQHASHVRKSAERAILGPKALAVLFGSNYFLSKSYCERPEALGRLTAAVSEVCGDSVVVQIKAVTAPATPVQSTTSNPRNTSGRRSPSSVQNDPFVQQAVAMFGGSVAEVRETVPTGPAPGDPGS